MTAPVPPADAYVPVNMRWRLIRAGDVVLDPNGAPWMVTASCEYHGSEYYEHWNVVLERAATTIDRNRDPEQTVRVLVPWPEAASILALRQGLGPVHVLDRNEVA